MIHKNPTHAKWTKGLKDPYKWHGWAWRRKFNSTPLWYESLSEWFKDYYTHFTMLSSMHNDLIRKFDKWPTTQDMWDKLR